MKVILFFCIVLLSGNTFLCARDYAQWPADKSETGFIEASQSREIKLQNLILPQKIDVQDRMRLIFTGMMEDAARKTGWQMVELSEYTNNRAMQSGRTPYPLRSPGGINVTFQFIVTQDSLQDWKNYQRNYTKNTLDNEIQNNKDPTAAAESFLYKHYHDSVNYYMNLYITYTASHQNVGADGRANNRRVEFVKM